jgi:hypothetical protein
VAGGGSDTAWASVDFSLAVLDGVENLTLTGVIAVAGTGNALANALTGNALNNTLTGLEGNDTLDGGGGVDTAVYAQIRAAYTISGGGVAIAGAEGNDTLANIERLQFSDRKLAFDLGLGQAAGNTVRIIGAAFDAPLIIPAYVGAGLNLFDLGTSMGEVCELVVQIMGLDNPAFVNTVYMNVVGMAPSTQEVDFFVSLLAGGGGTMTQAALLELAASIEINELNINLVGLQASGVEFV